MDLLQTEEILLGRVKLGVLELVPGSSDEDLVSSSVSTSSVMSSVRNPPRVVGDHPDRVKDPSDKVVVSLEETKVSNARGQAVFSRSSFVPSSSRTDLVLGEGSVTALVSEDPKTHSDASGGEPVDVPESSLEEEVGPVRKSAVSEGRAEGERSDRSRQSPTYFLDCKAT